MKYELTEETIEYKGRILRRVKSIESTKFAAEGSIGGFVESENNLSGDAWVSGDAKVYGDAEVSGDTTKPRKNAGKPNTKQSTT